jgi:hypothetical protein
MHNGRIIRGRCCVEVGNMTSQIYLSRRNLLTLLSKLDRAAAGEETACTLIKHDNVHPRYPQTMGSVRVTAVEDADYYTMGPPGEVHPSDLPT